MTTDTNLPLVFTGQFCVDDGGGMVDVSDEITGFQIHFTVDVLDIPATAGQPKSARGGGVQATIEIGFLSTDGSGGTLFPKLWTAAATNAKTLNFIGTMRDGSVGPTNPSWAGTFIVAGADLGGEAETLSVSSQTFPLTAMPTFVNT